MADFNLQLSATLSLYGLFLFLSWSAIVSANNIPCVPRAGDPGQGHVCVCNSTYCDTIERPSRLVKGQYYLYTTSNSTPGFTQTTGTFTADSVYDDGATVFTINSSALRQEVLGFGGSFTDAAGIVINTLPEGAKENLIKSYFGGTGIEYSLGRVPIGGTDFSTRFYTLDDYPDDFDLQHFNLTYEDYDIRIPLIKKAIDLSSREMKLYGCAWNSPSWMKTSQEVVLGYVQYDSLRIWAEYHVKFIKAYGENGVPIWGISGGNEVMSPLLYKGIVGTALGQLESATTQTLWFRYHLHPLLEASNYSDVKILALDDQRLYSLYWMERLANEPEAYEAVTGIALHWYSDWLSTVSILDDLHKNYPDKLILYTETSINPFMFEGTPVEVGSWERGAAYIYNIIENFNHWANGYMDWNLALDTNGGPYLNIATDAPILVNETNGEFYKQPMFYAMGHFSKFIPPGSRIVEVTSNQNQSDTNRERLSQKERSAMFQNYVLRRGGDRSGSLPGGVGFPPPGFVTVPEVVISLASANSDGSHTIIVLNSKNMTERVQLVNPQVGSVTLNVEPNSINTFVYWLE